MAQPRTTGRAGAATLLDDVGAAVLRTSSGTDDGVPTTGVHQHSDDHGTP